ncbi:hypothetical protein DC366_19235 [Pelagivirga sediminicola]|uniref:Uncharacterized protein n=1 Tax=Pelagivirga sediminicola TaxID=2170575 RepID=A0A2T7G202_9RHOB|nr:hypothetical protein [Pelagivirga sediminicola]PVA08447.1 hypothetical protein DC366_19235 [Pelagivirga sediminicola]
MQRCSLDEILRTAKLVPFEQKHIQFLISLIKKQSAKGLVVRFHPLFAFTPQEALSKMRDGVFVLTCPQIQADFVFLCESGGKGLLGGQKRVFRVFAGDLEQDEFSAASSYKSFGIAATSVNNIFRSEGLLSGAV